MEYQVYCMYVLLIFVIFLNKEEYHKYCQGKKRTIMSILTYNEMVKLLHPLQTQQPPQQQQPQQQNNKNQNNNKNNKTQPKQYLLDLSHHQLRKIPLQLPSSDYIITDINASYNYFKDLYNLNNQPNPNLIYINLSFNFLTSVCLDGSNFINLSVIDLNANRIQSVDIKEDDFPRLEALYLKNNRIKYFVNCPAGVRVLCLDHNLLEKLAFTGGESLEILSASSNRIQKIELEHPQKLVFLDLEQNLMNDRETFEKLLSSCINLLSVNLIGNYISKIGHKKYLISVLTHCEKVVKVDQIIINPHVRQAFKTLKQQENLQKMLEQTQQAYMNRMKQQLALKQQMLDKLNEESKKIQDNFMNFLKNQKQHVDALENYAKSNLGAHKLRIIEENKGMKQNVGQYIGIDQNNSQVSQDYQEKQKNKLIQEHKRQYLQYHKNNANAQKTQKSQRNASIKSDDDNQQLTPHEQERRRNNMRNPTLVYRNSNRLMINPQQLFNKPQQQKTKTSKKAPKFEQQILNPKCIPYLEKKYVFHTVK